MIEDVVIVREGGVVEIDEAVVLVVADSNAHRRGLSTVLVESVAGGVAGVLESAVAFVEIDVVGS